MNISLATLREYERVTEELKAFAHVYMMDTSRAYDRPYARRQGSIGYVELDTESETATIGWSTSDDCGVQFNVPFREFIPALWLTPLVKGGE
jgi:hypothetical protein